MRVVVAVIVGLLLAAPAVAQPPTTPAAIRDAALTDPTAWNILESLTTEVGPRLAGTPAAERARDWGVAKLRELGFTNIRVEPFPIQSWVRGAESAEVISPYPQKLTILGLGRSPPTPREGIEAPIVVFSTYAEMMAQPVGAFTGKIVVVNQPMRATEYGALGPNRRAGASEASRRGAVGYMTRSLTPANTDFAHTGASNPIAGVTPIPAAALSPPSADLLARMAARGQPVRVRMKLESGPGGSTAWTVSGDLTGTTRPDEIIVIGGHLDSWDVGTGAVDDGAGIAVTTAAARLASAGGRNQRTIRVVMWGAEEMAFAGQAYLAAHRDELSKFVLTSESDTGADGALALRLPAGALNGAAFRALPALLEPLKVVVEPTPATGAGDDVAGIISQGVPAFSFRLDGSRYFDLHHSADDTLDKVDRAKLNQMVAAWSVMLNLAANTDQNFRPPAPTTQAP